MFDLEALGFFYHSDFKPLSAILEMIYEHTGMFGPLTTDQKEIVKNLQDHITLSSSVDEVFLMGRPMADLSLRKIIPCLQLSMPRDKKQLLSIADDFVRNVVVMVKRAIEKNGVEKHNVTEDVFVDLFKSFVKMCDLLPVNGSEWKSKRTILHQEITSSSDIVIQTEDYLAYTGSKTVVSVVSIEEVKNMTAHITVDKKQQSRNSRPLRKTSSTDCEHPVHDEPVIFKRIGKNVLAQHGGELLLHLNIYSSKYIDEKRKCYWLPGMIVIGTQITFTLLEYNFDHLKEVENSGVVEVGRSCIYYSEPKDLLKKEDRDLLLESFARLTNSVEYS